MKIGIAGPADPKFIAAQLGLERLLPSDCPKGLGGTPVNLLVVELLRRGHEVSIYTLDPMIHEGRVIRLPRLDIYVGPFRRLRMLDFFAREKRFISDAISTSKPDVVHAHWLYEYALAAKKSELPLVVTAHDAPWQVLRYMPRPYRVGRLLMAYGALSGTHHLTAVSPHVATHLGKYMFARRSIEVIPNGLPDEMFRKARIRSISAKRATFATILNGWAGLKNGQTAIRAFQLFRAKFPDAKLVMFGAGHGPNEDAEKWAIANGLDGRIEFAGSTPYPDVLRRLSQDVDVLVHPSLEEALGMVLIEATALGVPVIAGSDSGGVAWTLGCGEAGILTDVRSATQVARAMETCVGLPGLAERQAQMALEFSRNRYSISKVTEQYERAYARAMEEHTK